MLIVDIEIEALSSMVTPLSWNASPVVPSNRTTRLSVTLPGVLR